MSELILTVSGTVAILKKSDDSLMAGAGDTQKHKADLEGPRNHPGKILVPGRERAAQTQGSPAGGPTELDFRPALL
jgi:hypothetical protein